MVKIEEIRAELGRRKMRQKELARKLRISENTLSKKMNGLIPFTLFEAEQIIKILKLPVSVFIDIDADG